MKISLLSDAPKHNLALMKLSTYHKKSGDEVRLNMPLWNADLTYGSWLFDNSAKERADLNGGPGYGPLVCLPPHIERTRPDYSLFGMKHSLGYTFRGCRRKCKFCKVPLMHQNFNHYSIWDFADARFTEIELLNNNTFYDSYWEDTFKEIYKAGLKIIDSSGFDLRLLDDKKAWWLKRLKWVGRSPRFAWDRMRDEKKIREGLRLLNEHKVKGCTVYILMGFDSTFEEDLYRCEIINGYGYDPYPMLFRSTPTLWRFRKFLYGKGYRQYSTIAEAWRNYNQKGGTHAPRVAGGD